MMEVCCGVMVDDGGLLVFGNVYRGQRRVKRSVHTSSDPQLSDLSPHKQPTWNFMFPVPEASVPAREICSLRSAAGMIFSARETR